MDQIVGDNVFNFNTASVVREKAPVLTQESSGSFKLIKEQKPKHVIEVQKSRIDATVLEMPIPLPVVVRKRDEKAELKVEEKNEKIE